MLPRSLLATVLLASAVSAEPALTTIQDVLYKADGTRFNGTLTISWHSFQSADSSAVVMQSTTVRVLDGNLRVQLVPGAAATPPSTYSVVYNSDGRVQFRETWSVPVSQQPLRVSQVRVATSSAGSSTAAGDTSSGTTSVTESDVTGLLADLGSRPVKGPGYAPAGAAIVDSSGLLETAAGVPTDCLHVDGSSGPCGAQAPSFTDADIPAGVVDGSNATFTLSATPAPTASLSLYRNGLLQKAGQDYTLTGQSLQFAAGAVPQPGDTLLASYRLDGSAGTTSSYPVAQVLCSGNGTSVSSSALASVGACTIPGGILQAGDRVEIHFDLSHQGTAAGFTFEVDWGATAIVHRTGAASDAQIAGRADAAILSSGAQLDVQSWGTVLGFATGVGNATDAYANGLTINFQASASGGDSVAMSEFSVVRLP
ncbi:MAG TPA: hypothetical protein VMA31_07265 [Bryobacteraceae bacterium]|nr:hypothetical protein [Bryobacteraceae bacterium]